MLRRSIAVVDLYRKWDHLLEIATSNWTVGEEAVFRISPDPRDEAMGIPQLVTPRTTTVQTC